MTQIEPYDEAGFEQFCIKLAELGFNPRPDNPNRWVGPIHPALRKFSDADFMDVLFRDGWPLKYAYVIVDGLRLSHVRDGTICLWSEDDPAQLDGATIAGLWTRIDLWADAATTGFDLADRALDSYMHYTRQNNLTFELPLADLAAQTNGYLTQLSAELHGRAVLAGVDQGREKLHGAFYLRRDIGTPPANFEEFRESLTKRQREDLDRRLADRAPAELNQPSEGYDFVALAWPRFGQHDVLVLGFSGAGQTLEATAYMPSPSDATSRRRRAGLDADALSTKNVLIAGLGSVGGGVALMLAESGLGDLIGYDHDTMKTTNLVRHALSRTAVGHPKVDATDAEIADRAPWCDFQPRDEELQLDPSRLAQQITGYDLIVDTTGNFAVSAALSQLCHQLEIPLLIGALFHHGHLLRIQRQTAGDTPIASRVGNPLFVQLPPETIPLGQSGFLEAGCTSIISNSPPWASSRAAADVAASAVDLLTGRLDFPEDQVSVLRPLSESPFDRVGPVLPRR